MRFSAISLLLAALCAPAFAADDVSRDNLEKIAIRAYATQQFATALAAYEKISALEPSAFNFGRTGDAAASAARWSDARRWYKKALRESVRGGNAEGVALFRGRLAKLPVDPSIVSRLIEEERYDEAFRRAKEYLNLNAGDIWAMATLGFIYEKIGQDKPAEKLYKQALKIAPEHPAPHYYYGQFLLQKKKKFDEALEHLKLFRQYLGAERGSAPERRQEAENQRLQATLWIASILDTVLKRPEEAFRELEPVVRSGKADAETLYAYGSLAARVGKKMTAYNAWQKLIKTAPDSAAADAARQAIEYLRSNTSDGIPYADPYS